MAVGGKNLPRQGQASFTYTLAYSKSNQTAADRPENVKPVEGIAGDALQAWLVASGVKEGAIFAWSGKVDISEYRSPLPRFV